MNKVPFNHLSHIWTCKSCGKRIKINMVSKKLEPPTYCYRCWVSKEKARGHLMRESGRGKRVNS